MGEYEDWLKNREIQLEQERIAKANIPVYDAAASRRQREIENARQIKESCGPAADRIQSILQDVLGKKPDFANARERKIYQMQDYHLINIFATWGNRIAPTRDEIARNPKPKKTMELDYYFLAYSAGPQYLSVAIDGILVGTQQFLANNSLIYEGLRKALINPRRYTGTYVLNEGSYTHEDNLRPDDSPYLG